MQTPPNSASGLFRSLGADDSYFDTRAKASALEAAQRWPLFKATSTAKNEPAPEMSDQQKAAWGGQQHNVQEGRKPALSKPGLSGKLANSLSKLTQPIGVSSRAPSKNAPSLSPPATPRLHSNVGSGLTPKPTHSEMVAPQSRLEIFAKAPARAASAAAITEPKKDDSLKRIFSRLEGKQEKSTGLGSSFLNRLAKR
jgi:hypothetical protein